MELTAYGAIKLLVWPALVMSILAAKRCLPSQHPLRRFVASRDSGKLAALLIVAVWIAVGAWLTLAHG